ncbi:DUF6088 family protein [Pseudomonas benzenivorans]|uniref:Transcriptional regulator, AbiEi antitoxin, Type IV TA system n=1 Tax=Pseudomonas benzenivorans TaxID=556533 RepID=A0ABY5H6Q8_9PSED|nr:DUF6088 family protein [Pseudomonas benzenivorans]UTW07996.1 hypothetical protein KDW96_01270 [Pseudomonas benzenivorans]
MFRNDQALSVSTRIAQQVKHLPKGQPFSIRRFAELGTRNAVSKAIARLINRGELERVYRGIYMRRKAGQYVARIRPSAWEVVSLIARQSRQVLQPQGADAVRRFGLSTQMPLIPIYYTSGHSRSLFIGRAEVRLIHAAPVVMQHAGTEVGLAISALFYLGKDGSTPECTAAIKKALKHSSVARTAFFRAGKYLRPSIHSSPFRFKHRSRSISTLTAQLEAEKLRGRRGMKYGSC